MKRCKYCGTYFKAGYNGRKIFCSNQCGVKWWHKQHKKKRICIVCGNQIMTRSHRYCSDECRKTQAKKRVLEQVDRAKFLHNRETIDLCLNCTAKDCDDGWCAKIQMKYDEMKKGDYNET